MRTNEHLFCCVLWLLVAPNNGEVKIVFLVKEATINVTVPDTMAKINMTVISPGNLTAREPAKVSVYGEVFVVAEAVIVKFKILLSSTTCELCHKAVDVDIDICRLLRMTKGPMGYIRRGFNALKKYGSLPKRCPIQPEAFYVKDLVIDNAMFPSYIPEGPLAFSIALRATVDGNSVEAGELKVKGEVHKIGA